MSHDKPARLDRIRERALRNWRTLPERIDRYQVRGELGRGSMGVVYDGFDPVLQRRVAVKVMATVESPALQHEFAERLAREMRAAGRIFHSNVVSVLDAGVVEANGSRPYFVMERVAGPSLEEARSHRHQASMDEATADAQSRPASLPPVETRRRNNSSGSNVNTV